MCVVCFVCCVYFFSFLFWLDDHPTTMGNLQDMQHHLVQYESGIDPLDPTQTESSYRKPLPTTTTLSPEKLKEMAIRRTLNANRFHNREVKEQIISPPDQAVTMVTAKEISEAISNSFNWFMGDVKNEKPMMDPNEGLYYLTALQDFAAAERLVRHDSNQTFNMTNTTVTTQNPDSETKESITTIQKIQTPLLAMACKSATGTLNEITFNPRLFTKSIDPNQNEVNMLKTLETLPCTLVIQDTDNDNKNASIRVKLDNNPRLSFVTAVLETYEHTLNELTSSLKLVSFAGRWDISIVIFKEIIQLTTYGTCPSKKKQEPDLKSPENPENVENEAGIEEEEPVDEPPTLNNLDRENLQKVVTMICGNHHQSFFETKNKTSNSDHCLIHNELRMQCFDLFASVTLFQPFLENIQNSGSTSNLPPLYQAFKTNDEFLLRRLFSKNTNGSNMTPIDFENQTTNLQMPPVLFYAIKLNSPQIQFLLEQYMKKDNGSMKKNTKKTTTKRVYQTKKGEYRLYKPDDICFNNKTPLAIAIEYKHTHLEEMLGKAPPKLKSRKSFINKEHSKRLKFEKLRSQYFG